MTGERDMERILERWLVDGIDEMPDRVYLSVVDRVERQPQQRAWRVSWRDSTVNAYLKPILAIAAVIVLTVGGIAVIARPSGSDVGVAVPTASPTPSPQATPSPPALPAGRLEPRQYVARTLPDDSMAFVVTAPEGWSGFGGWAMSGPRGPSGPDGIGFAFLHDPQVVNDACGAGGAAPSGAPTAPSVDDLVAALSAHPGVNVTGVTDTELAGYSGKLVELELPRDLPCSQYYVFAEPQGFYAQGLSNRWRIAIVDVDGETAVVVLTDYAQTSAQDSAAAQAVLDSLRINP